jgi:hypothetical protein
MIGSIADFFFCGVITVPIYASLKSTVGFHGGRDLAKKMVIYRRLT